MGEGKEIALWDEHVGPSYRNPHMEVICSSLLLKGGWGAALLTKMPQNIVLRLKIVPSSPLPLPDE